MAKVGHSFSDIVNDVQELKLNVDAWEIFWYELARIKPQRVVMVDIVNDVLPRLLSTALEDHVILSVIAAYGVMPSRVARWRHAVREEVYCLPHRHTSHYSQGWAVLAPPDMVIVDRTDGQQGVYKEFINKAAYLVEYDGDAFNIIFKG